MKSSVSVSLWAPVLIALLAANPVRAEDVDGHYKGTYSSTGACSGGGPVEMQIRNRSFTRQFGPNQRFEATVAPDGSVSSQLGQASMTGTVKSGHVELDLGSARGNCRVHQVLDKT